MFNTNGLGQRASVFIVILVVAALLGGCCGIGYRCGSPCGQCNSCGHCGSCGGPWPNGYLEMGFKPSFGCNSGCCYDPCYPFGGKVTSGSSSRSGNQDSGYLSDSDSGGSGTGYY